MTRFGVGLALDLNGLPNHCESVRNLGCKEVRFGLRWCDIEQTQGSYNWSWYDERIAVVRNAGLGILPVVYLTPAWHRASTKEPPDPQVYAGFCRKVAEHYRCPAYEIWNEPDNPAILDWSGSKEQYADMYRAARQALHAVNPDYDAILGGLTYIDPLGYLRPIWNRLGLVDAVGFHPYGFGADPAADTMVKLKRLVTWLNSVGSLSTPVDVTEIGLPVGIDVGGSRRYTEKDRAGFLKKLATNIQDWKRIRRWNVYTWHNHPEWDIAEANGTWKGGASGYAKGIAS